MGQHQADGETGQGNRKQKAGAASSQVRGLLAAPPQTNQWKAGEPIISTTVGKEGMIIYRVHGPGGARGAWGATVRPATQLQARTDLALPPEWNQATHVSTIRLSPGTRIQIGIAGPQGNLPGGARQVRILNSEDIVYETVETTAALPVQ